MLTIVPRLMLIAVVAAVFAPALVGCDSRDKPNATQPATQPGAADAAKGDAKDGAGTSIGGASTRGAATRGSAAGAAAKDGCPTEAEIAAVIGSPVKRLKGFGCSYESADGETHVSIIIAAAASADKLLEEMRETAAAYPNAKVEPVADVGERAHMYGTRGQATCVAVAGGKAYWVDVSSAGGAAVDRKPQVIQILRLLMR